MFGYFWYVWYVLCPSRDGYKKSSTPQCAGGFGRYLQNLHRSKSHSYLQKTVYLQSSAEEKEYLLEQSARRAPNGRKLNSNSSRAAKHGKACLQDLSHSVSKKRQNANLQPFVLKEANQEL